MVPPRGTQWSITPHTQAKHHILRRYLEAWLPILAAYNDRLVYIDGFAGPGRYEGGEPGSPLIALATILDHPRFRGAGLREGAKLLFIEKEADRAAELRAELDRFAEERRTAGHPIPEWISYDVRHAEFAPTMTKL